LRTRPLDAERLLTTTLKRVSRSFFLSVRILPRDVRRPIGLAYLLARAADTIADTPLISRSDRVKHLELFREALREQGPGRLATIKEALSGPHQLPAERALLMGLEDAFGLLRTVDTGDRELIVSVVLTLTDGMVWDLSTFPGEDEGGVAAVQTRAELDRYTYYIAGCVGEFWTDIHLSHRPSLRSWDRDVMVRRGVRFGKGLQMTNVLRDVARDLRIGRCYLPGQELERLGLRPEDLLDPAAIDRVRPLLLDLIAAALDHYQEGWSYTLAIPRREVRMRLACAWPLFIGLKTLALIARSPNLLDPRGDVKVSRRAVYAMMLRSAATIGSDVGLSRYYRSLRGAVPLRP
jgi:farnesyl-diphosphate farnesyltransferase